MSAQRSIDLPCLVAHLSRTQREARRLVAITGAPGSGKSTFTEHLCAQLNENAAASACVLAMDGFHFDDRVLESRGHRARKGAPYTFDVAGLAVILQRLKADDGVEVAVPVFDRSLEIARAGAAIIPASARIVLVEGNYLLLEDLNWIPLRKHFDMTVQLDVPRHTLAERLASRWQGYGLDEAAVRAKLEGNDLPNCELVVAHSAAADFIVPNF